MLSVAVHVPRFLAIIVMLTAASSSALAAPQTGSRPLVLGTESGIGDSKPGGTELQTAPLSSRRAAGTQPLAAPGGPYPDGSAAYPFIVTPYIEVPAGVPGPPYPSPRPRPMPR